MSEHRTAAQVPSKEALRKQRSSQTGFPFKKIVYVGDVSQKSSYGLRYVQKLAEERHGEIVLVHSLDPIVYALPSAALSDSAAQAELSAMEHDPQRHGANHNSMVQRERVRDEIVGEVRRHAPSLLVLGSVGQTAAARIALATMARLLLASSTCSILTVPTPAGPDALPRWMWQNVIAATDFSDAGVAALDVAQRVAGRGLTVLHSTECGKEQHCSHCIARLLLLAPFNESHTLPVEHIVGSGALPASLASLAQRLHPDLLVLGAPSVPIDADELSTSTIYRVIVASDCPVLLVPPASEESRRTIDPMVYEWLDKVRCKDGQAPFRQGGQIQSVE